MIYEHLTIHD